MAAVLCNNKWQSFIYTYSYILGMIQENVPGGTLGGGGGGGGGSGYTYKGSCTRKFSGSVDVTIVAEGGGTRVGISLSPCHFHIITFTPIEWCSSQSYFGVTAIHIAS